MNALVKLPQNVQALIGEIGEKQVLLRLLLLTLDTPWEVFHNLGESGYDILLLNPQSKERVRVGIPGTHTMIPQGVV